MTSPAKIPGYGVRYSIIRVPDTYLIHDIAMAEASAFEQGTFDIATLRTPLRTTKLQLCGFAPSRNPVVVTILGVLVLPKLLNMRLDSRRGVIGGEIFISLRNIISQIFILNFLR